MIETLDRLLSAHGLAHLRERIVAMMRPAVGLQSTPAGRDGLPPLGTRLGGAPALRTEADWPCNSGKKLDFLLQLDLSELRSLAGSEVLPPSGLLQFFYDVETPAGSVEVKEENRPSVEQFEVGERVAVSWNSVATTVVED